MENSVSLDLLMGIKAQVYPWWVFLFLSSVLEQVNWNITVMNNVNWVCVV